MKKVIAFDANDHVMLSYLKNCYPELFDATFLLDLLRNECDRVKSGQNDDVQFQYYLKNAH